MEFVDTHCHVHELNQPVTPTHDKWFSDKQTRTVESVLQTAKQAGVTTCLAVGTTLKDSELAISFAAEHPGAVGASVGIHPHEAKDHLSQETKERFEALATQTSVVAVGECGLDYFYHHSPKEQQEEILRFQIELALQRGLPMSFHVRGAFDDFWPIFESYQGVRGVLHSFTDSHENMERALQHGLYIGVNGIATFTQDQTQLAMYKAIPDQALLLETDAPYLTPKPFRGKVCEPKHVVLTAEFMAALRSSSLEEIAKITTANAQKLFNL
jgi:TatD DNase family protein